jgi:hypothetical protein
MCKNKEFWIRSFLSSGLLRCVVWSMLTNVSEVILPSSSGRWDRNIHTHRCENLKSYICKTTPCHNPKDSHVLLFIFYLSYFSFSFSFCRRKFICVRGNFTSGLKVWLPSLNLSSVQIIFLLKFWWSIFNMRGSEIILVTLKCKALNKLAHTGKVFTRRYITNFWRPVSKCRDVIRTFVKFVVANNYQV